MSFSYKLQTYIFGITKNMFPLREFTVSVKSLMATSCLCQPGDKEPQWEANECLFGVKALQFGEHRFRRLPSWIQEVTQIVFLLLGWRHWFLFCWGFFCCCCLRNRKGVNYISWRKEKNSFSLGVNKLTQLDINWWLILSSETPGLSVLWSKCSFSFWLLK